MKLFQQLPDIFKLIFSNSPTNSTKFFFDNLSSRLRPKVVSLNWGSHREEHSIARHIKDWVLETSPNLLLCVKDHVIDNFTHRHVFNDRAIYRLRDATFDPATGDTYLENKLILESHSDGPTIAVRRTVRARKLHGRPLIGVPFQTHYHWLIETLPRVIAATRFEPSALLVAPTRLSALQHEAIDILGHEVLFTDDYCQSDDFILATRGRDSGWAHPSDLDILRSVYEVPSKAGTNNIFISRISSSRADAISVAMHEYAVNTGWNVILSEELTFEKHLRLFGQANVIAGEHGAGLTNLALAPLKTRLIEFTNPSYANPCYNALSLVLNNSNDYYSAHSRTVFKDVLKSSRQITS